MLSELNQKFQSYQPYCPHCGCFFYLFKDDEEKKENLEPEEGKLSDSACIRCNPQYTSSTTTAVDTNESSKCDLSVRGETVFHDHSTQENRLPLCEHNSIQSVPNIDCEVRSSIQETLHSFVETHCQPPHHHCSNERKQCITNSGQTLRALGDYFNQLYASPLEVEHLMMDNVRQ